MVFKPVSNRASFPQMEEEVLRFWKERDIFPRSMREREGGPLFTFYEGPPTANGQPGVHHLLSRVFKDIIPRFKTMQGFYAPRKAGWDTHGLPVELEIERELGLRSKRDIDEYGIARFNEQCRKSVFRYVKDWESLTERIGFWLDMDQAYVTFTNEYVESLWWIFKQLWDRGLVYQDYKVTPHCPRCDTSLSSHEVALGYQENTPDPSIYVRFRLKDTERARAALGALDVPTSILTWTTTPWTLPANVGLAVAEEAYYSVVEGEFGQGRERFIVAGPLVDASLTHPYRVVQNLQGSALVGLEYEPLFTPEPVENAYRVIGGEFVSMEDGTGVVHIAPAYGAEDLEVGRREGLPLLHTVRPDGTIMDTLPAFAGTFVKEADPRIIQDIDGRGLLYRDEVIHHTYPFCWRCDTPLVYYAKTSWYIRTTAVKGRLLSGNEEINWYPEHIKRGRFGEWLSNNIDWAVSRERYWGTPMPIWTCADCGMHQCVGSLAELRERPGVEGASEELDLHRPFVDQVTFACPECCGLMRRQPEVLDAWYDSGAMPVAQWHYPFENQETFQAQFPADYICEAVDQTRGWFYTLHALSTLLFDGPSYRNVICLGHILDEAGEKMSKSRGNVVEPWPVIQQHGADALRWYMYTISAPGNPRRFSANLIGEAVRRFLLPLWNIYSFFVTYANIDGFDPASAALPAARAPLDRWILAELSALVRDVTVLLEGYNPTDAGRRIQDFVEDLSNWYVRRSRRRFWKPALSMAEGNQNDQDKLAAYHTLHQVLTTLARLLAPFTPFVAEEIYRNLVAGVDGSAPESVHLSTWPQADADLMDEGIVADTRLAIRLSSLGRAARSKAGIRVRQTLARALVVARSQADLEAIARVADQVGDELNVKEIVPVEEEAVFQSFSVQPNNRLLGPKYGSRLSEVAEALAGADPAETASAVRAGRRVPVGSFTLEPEEVVVEVTDREGFASAQEGGYAVAVETRLSPELVQEGLAREVVHHIQTMRRAAGFDIADRIATYYRAEGPIPGVVGRFGDYIRQETLSQELVPGPPPEGAHKESIRLGGVVMELGVVRWGDISIRAPRCT